MKRFFYMFLASAILSACGNNKKTELTDKIEALEQILFGGTQMFNDSAAQAVVSAYSDFAESFPEDTISPEYLFKAGEVSLGLNQPSEAMKYYKKVCDQYPKFKRSSYSLFLQAYVLDNYLNDDNQAGEIYKMFIQKYPDHPMVKDAEFSIRNLGKSDEELIKEFEAKQAAKGA